MKNILGLSLVVLCFVSVSLFAQEHKVGERGFPQNPEFRENRSNRPQQPLPPINKEMEKQRKQMEKSVISRQLLLIEVELPEKYSNLIKLQQDNPREFHEMLGKLSREIEGKKQKENKEFNELVNKYQESKSDELKTTIRKKLEIEFEKKRALQKKRVQKLGEAYEKAKETLAKRETGKDTIIDEKLQQVISDPDLKW